jgi:GTPase involved in cell partitioning and DNA repair
MANGNFVDYVKIYLRSGDGGPGSAHFYRAKYQYSITAETEGAAATLS